MNKKRNCIQYGNTNDDDNLIVKNKIWICFSGGAAIKRYSVLNDKRHILTKDTDNNVAIYDVLKVTKVKDLGTVDFDNELKQHNQKVFIPNWFTVDLKTGVCILAFRAF